MRAFFFKKNIFFLLFIFTVSIFFLELLLKIYGLGDPIVYETNMSYRYAPKANQSVVRLNKSKVSINESGLRSPNEWRNNNNHKVLFFGDSVTYGGSYIDDKEIFSELVCYNLNLLDKKKYLCGNAGVNAYGVDNINNRILYGELKDSEWIVVTLIEADGFRSLQDVMAIPAFLDKPRFFPAIQEVALHLTWKFNIFLRNDYSNNSTFQIKKKNISINIFKKSFKNLNNTLIQEISKGKKVLVVFHPSKESVLDGIESAEYKLMKNIFKEEKSKIIFLDMFPIIKSSYSSHIYYDSVHLNKKSHFLFAAQISKIINQYDNKY